MNGDIIMQPIRGGVDKTIRLRNLKFLVNGNELEFNYWRIHTG